VFWIISLHMQGYNFRIDDNFKPIGMEDTADAGVEFVELVNGTTTVDVPKNAVI